jgi:predicted nuclease of predicted toxin-antitoxin system
VRILLDENFSLQLYYRLRSAGYEVEHIILIGDRGIPDSAIRERVARESLLFLTQDSEFENIPADSPGTIIVSCVR